MASVVDDDELMRRTAAGDRSAYAEVVRRHHGAVLRYARALVADSADDVAQQAFLDGMRGAASFAGRASVRTWLLTLTRNAAFRGRRRRAGEPERHVPLHELGEAAGWGDPEQKVAAMLDAALLRRALSSLAEASREVLVLRELEGLSGKETADMLGISSAAMKSRLHRARLELAAAVRKECGDGT